jgi:hypothetical protein
MWRSVHTLKQPFQMFQNLVPMMPSYTKFSTKANFIPPLHNSSSPLTNKLSLFQSAVSCLHHNFTRRTRGNCLRGLSMVNSLSLCNIPHSPCHNLTKRTKFWPSEIIPFRFYAVRRSKYVAFLSPEWITCVAGCRLSSDNLSLTGYHC